MHIRIRIQIYRGKLTYIHIYIHTRRGKLVGWRDRMQQLQQVIQATRARQQQELAIMAANAQAQ